MFFYFIYLLLHIFYNLQYILLYSSHTVTTAGGLTALVPLTEGPNRLLVQCGGEVVSRKLVHKPPDSDNFVRLVYVTTCDEDQFQASFYFGF